tara:strand:- start:248 stop:5995 length:5748 start_codon:yes stop_codon:yes gene_type:complete
MLRNTTKFFLLTAILCSLLQTNAQSLNQEQLKDKLDSLWQSPSYLKHQGLTKKDLKKIPKYDRPDLAAEQDYYMTIDPNTLTVPSETKYGIMHMVDSINNASFGYAAISGVTWYERGPDNFGGRTRAIMFDPTDSANGYKKAWAGGVAGGLWYNGDITSASTAWSKVDDFWANMAITSMAYDPTDDSTFYVGTGEGWYNADAVRGQGVWKSTNAGQTWTQLSSTTGSAYYYIQKLVVTPTGRIVIATRSNIRYSDNGGTSWSSAASGVFADIEVSANGDLYASKGNVVTSGDILKSTNNGTSWSSILPSGAGTIRRVELACAPSDSNILYAVAGNTSYNVAWMKKSINAGSTWTDMAIPRYLNDTSVHFTRGQSWYDLILAVHPTNPAIVLAGGVDLHRTADSGATWAAVSHWYGGFSRPEVHADQHAIAFRPGANNEAMFGNDGGTYYSSNVGSSSSPSFSHSVNGYNVTQFYSVAMKDSLGSNYMLAGAQDNGSHQFTTSGVNSTREVTGGDGAFCFIDQDNPSYQITSYVRNNWRRSTNGGTSFSNITSNSTGRFINPADYDDDANILYAAAGNNQVYRVSGIAATSSVTTSTLTIGGSALGGVQASHLRCSPYSSHTLFIGTSSGGIYKVTGANSSPTSVDIDPNSDLPTGYISCIEVGASDSQLLITYTNYGVNSVWETQNAGTSWESKEGDLPNMPIRWALYNPNDRTQAMLATEVGVWTTDNLGATSVDWEPSNNGLANVRCDMLQIRSSDNEVAIATHARGLFTTNIFGDTSIKASFTASSDEICLGNSMAFTNTGTGNISNNTWIFTPSTVTFISGTDSSSTNPLVQFNAAGQYTVKLISADASASDVDSVTITNAVTAQSGRAFGNWTQNFDTITAAPTSYIDSIWSLDYGTTYLWEIDSNGTLSSNTGPAADFGGSGHYLYAEASTPALSGNLAYLQTGCITMPDTGYFKFGFHMYGSAMGTLGVDADTGTGWYSLGLITGEQHTADTSAWGEATLDLGGFNGAIARLRISALCGSSYLSDIAIDELRFQDRLYGCDTFVAATCKPTTGDTTYDDGVYGVKIGAVEYTSSGVDTDGEYTERVCTDTFTVSDRGFRLYVDAGNSYSNRVRAYIDYNNDGQFDTTNEMIWYSSKILGYRNDSITVPTTGVVKGSYLRMRIMADDNSIILNNPCGILSYGESEDFSIKIENDRCEIVGFSLGSDTTQCGGSVSLSAGTYTSYAWSTGATSSSISATATGIYSVLATDTSGCTGLDTIEVVINSLPTVFLGNDTTQCDGSITLSAGTYSSYLWNTGSTSSSIIASTTSTYSVSVEDANGCADTDSIDVVIHSLPSFSLGNDTVQCGGFVPLDPGTYSSYLWNTGSASNLLVAFTSGTYSVTVEDANGCFGSDTIEVTIHSRPNVDLGNDTTHCGGNVTLLAGSYTGYSWSTGSAASSISVATSGIYSVTVTDANGCEDTDDVEVTIYSLPSVDLGNDTTQCGGAVSLSAGSFSSYLWSTGSTSSAISAASSGTYSVTVIDANGCTDTDEVDVIINSLPSVNLGFDKEQCAGTIDLDAGNFTSYSWSTGSTAGSITVGSTGTYTVTVIDGNGCSNSDAINVTIHSLPEVNLGNDTTLCGGSVTLVAGTLSSQSYAWSIGLITSSITVSTSGSYAVTVTDANGCDQADDIQVTVHTPETDFLPTAADMCAGDMLDAGTGSNYVWSTGATSQSIAVSTSSTYLLTKLDANGCSVSDEVDVTIIPLPVAEFSFSIYNKTSTTFRTDFTNTSSNQDSVTWDFGNGSTSDLNSPSANFNTGSYDVTLIVINDCGEDTILKTVAFVAGVNEHLLGDIKVYPNPSSDFLMIVSEGDLNLDKVKLFDVYGKEVISWSSDIKTNQEIKLNTSDLASGTYYVTIISGDTKIVRRVIVTR